MKELEQIISIQGLTPADGLEARKKALDEWTKASITEIVIENSIIKKNLTSEDEDFLKYYLALQIAEKLMEECATVTSEDNKITVKVLALTKHFPKNKED